jgi:hypothetical protein
LPTLNANQSSFVRLRFAKYLQQFIPTNVSRNALGAALETSVSSSRVTAWLGASRIAKAETVFQIGEALRDRFGCATNGLEALYASAYWVEVFLLLMHLSINRAKNGDSIAVAAYCVLPALHRSFDEVTLYEQLRETRDCDQRLYKKLIRSSSYELYELERSAVLQKSGKALSTDASLERLELLDAAVDIMRGEAAQAAIATAWSSAALDRLRFTYRPDERHEDVSNQYGIDVLKSVMQVARSLRDAVSTVAGARLWRIAAEWADNACPPTYFEFRNLLPPLFITRDSPARHLSDEDAYELASIALSQESVQQKWLK